MTQEPDERMLSRQEVADFCGTDRRALGRWVRAGKIPAPERIGSYPFGKLVWKREVFIRWVVAGCPQIHQKRAQEIKERIRAKESWARELYQDTPEIS